jgi:hypothetical protein
MSRRYSVLALSILFLIQVAAARPQTPNSSLVTSPRPLEDASRRLQEAYGKVVTNEEPILTWRAELEARTGRNPEERWQLAPPFQSFSMPAIDAKTDLPSTLENILRAFHQQTSVIRFQVLSSKLGYHIVPVQMHDETGRSVSTGGILQQVITIPIQARTAQDHLLALRAALNRAQSLHVDISAVPHSPGGFDVAFRAEPAVFNWGVQSAVARDALIELLDRSATSFSWRLMCQPSAKASDRFCVLNVGLVEVEETDSEGRHTTRVLDFDRVAK